MRATNFFNSHWLTWLVGQTTPVLVPARADEVDALLAHSGHDPLRGLVVAATGNGTMHEELEAALLRAQASGVRVVLATRCAYGRVLPRSDATFPDSQGLSPVKARVALLLELALADAAPANSA